MVAKIENKNLHGGGGGGEMGHIYNIAKRWLVPLSCTHYQGFYYHGQLSLISYKLRDAGINKLFGKVSKRMGCVNMFVLAPIPLVAIPPLPIS